MSLLELSDGNALFYNHMLPSVTDGRTLRNAATADWNLPYEKLTLPVLVVTGLQDRVFLDAEDMETLYARLPNASRIDMTEAVHLLPAERPDTLVAALINFARAF